MFYVYILMDTESEKKYVGMTSNLKERIRQHQSRKTWTTSRMKNLKLIFYEAFLSKKDAVRREKYLKTSKGKSSLKQIIRESIQYARVV